MLILENRIELNMIQRNLPVRQKSCQLENINSCEINFNINQYKKQMVILMNGIIKK